MIFVAFNEGHSRNGSGLRQRKTLAVFSWKAMVVRILPFMVEFSVISDSINGWKSPTVDCSSSSITMFRLEIDRWCSSIEIDCSRDRHESVEERKFHRCTSDVSCVENRARTSSVWSRRKIGSLWLRRWKNRDMTLESRRCPSKASSKRKLHLTRLCQLIAAVDDRSRLSELAYANRWDGRIRSIHDFVDRWRTLEIGHWLKRERRWRSFSVSMLLQTSLGSISIRTDGSPDSMARIQMRNAW